MNYLIAAKIMPEKNAEVKRFDKFILSQGFVYDLDRDGLSDLVGLANRFDTALGFLFSQARIYEPDHLSGGGFHVRCS